MDIAKSVSGDVLFHETELAVPSPDAKILAITPDQLVALKRTDHLLRYLPCGLFSIAETLSVTEGIAQILEQLEPHT